MLNEDEGRPGDDLDDDLDAQVSDDDAVELSRDMAKALKDADEYSDDSDDEDDDSSAEEGDSAKDLTDDTADEPRRDKRTAQDRIKELARLRREAEQAAFELEMRNIELERQLAERVGSKDEAPKPPNPKDFTYGEVDPDYLTAMVDHKVALREVDIRTEAAKAAKQAEEREVRAKYEKRLAAVMVDGSKRFKDFEAVVGKTPYTPQIAQMILDSENAVDIAYYLANNVSELRTLVRAGVSEQARVIGRLEGRFSAASAVKKKTKAPEALGSHRSRESSKADGQFGPDNQDDFDKAFFR